jgi:hypothetical protein
MKASIIVLPVVLTAGLLVVGCSSGSPESGSSEADSVSGTSSAPGPYRCEALDPNDPDADPFTLTLGDADPASHAPLSIRVVVDDGFNIERSGKLAPPLPMPQVSDPAKSPIAKAIAAKNRTFDRYAGFDGFDDDATATFFVSKAIGEKHAAKGTVEVDLALPPGVPSAGSDTVVFNCTKLAATCKAFPKCDPPAHVDSATCSCVTDP